MIEKYRNSKANFRPALNGEGKWFPLTIFVTTVSFVKYTKIARG